MSRLDLSPPEQNHIHPELLRKLFSALMIHEIGDYNIPDAWNSGSTHCKEVHL